MKKDGDRGGRRNLRGVVELGSSTRITAGIGAGFKYMEEQKPRNLERVRLEMAYRATAYCVFLPGGAIVLRIGKAAARMDRYLQELGTSSWAFLSAANPGSVALPDEENLLRHRELCRELDDRGLSWVAAEGRPDQVGWNPEISVVVFGLGKHEALDLARQYRQMAILWGTVGSPAELVWC